MPHQSTHTTSLAPAAARHLACGWAACVRLFTLAVLILSLTSPGAAWGQDGSQPAGRTALVVEMKGAIGPATTEYLRQAFATASARDAAVIVLRMDTPGGLSSSTRDIIHDILASPVPVIAYVAPSGARAASAGTYILYASHLAAMAPGTNLGAATPVQIGGTQPLGGDKGKDGKETLADAETAKLVNDAAAFMRSLAELRGRNATWGEEAVRQAASLSAREALERHVIEIIATDLDDLLAKADGRRIEVNGQDVTLKTVGLRPAVLEPNWRAGVLGILTDPNIAYILMLIGLYGIIFEFMSPGAVAPGVVGSISLLVGLFALNLLPINYAGLGLLLLGVALMVAEVLAPSFILGAGGIGAFALGSLLLFDQTPGFALSLPVVVTATAVSAALFMVMLAAVVRAHRRRVVSGEEAMIGEAGTILSWGGARGEVRVHGERWQARATGADSSLMPGVRVRVRGRDRLVLMVEPERPPEA